MTPYESHPALAHMLLTAAVIVVHFILGMAFRKRLAPQDRGQRQWFLFWHCLLISTMVNLTLLFPNPPWRQVVLLVTGVPLLPLLVWGFWPPV